MRIFVPCLLLLCWVLPGIGWTYDPPNLDAPLVDADAVHLDEATRNGLVEALVAVACNFPKSDLVDSDLRERALALALNLDRLNVNARKAHRHLTAGTAPPGTGYFTESVSQVSEKLWSTAEALAGGAPDSENAKLAVCLQELSLLLHPAPPPSRVQSYQSMARLHSPGWEEAVSTQPDRNPSTRKLEALRVGRISPPAATPPAADPAIKRDLVRHLLYLCDFESSDGSVDQGPRGKGGKAEGIAVGPGRGGRSSKAILFRDNSGCLKLPVDLSPHETPEATVCAWVRVDGVEGNGADVFSQVDGRGHDRAVILRRGKGESCHWGLHRGISGGWSVADKEPVVPGQWTFVAATFDHRTLRARLYVNENEYGYVASFGKGEKELSVGNGRPGHCFSGAIDDLCVFNCALTSEEIDALRTGAEFRALVEGSGGVSPGALSPNRSPSTPGPTGNSLTRGLIYACNFEESDGSIDQSSKGNHGISAGLTAVAGPGGGQLAVHLDGKTARLLVPLSLRPDDYPNLTLSLWLKPDRFESSLSVPFSTGRAETRGIRLGLSRGVKKSPPLEVIAWASAGTSKGRFYGTL